jgi:hypothetical protein
MLFALANDTDRNGWLGESQRPVYLADATEPDEAAISPFLALGRVWQSQKVPAPIVVYVDRRIKKGGRSIGSCAIRLSF